MQVAQLPESSAISSQTEASSLSKNPPTNNKSSSQAPEALQSCAYSSAASPVDEWSTGSIQARRKFDRRLSGPSLERKQKQTGPEVVRVNIWSKPNQELLKKTPPPIILKALQSFQQYPVDYGSLNYYARYLVKKRQMKPNHAIYEAQLSACCGIMGSADRVREIFKDMRERNVQATSSIYHLALRALSIHSDYLVRNSILHEMKENWVELTLDGHCSVALGLLRDGQYEMALGKLENMMRDGHQPPRWVYDTFVYALARLGFLDDALDLLQYRVQNVNDPIALPVWAFMLDECSSGLHLAGTRYVWNCMVVRRVLTPSDGTIVNVLNTAARHGDTQLASQALQHLSARRIRLAAHHFEAFIGCYAANGDATHALEALCIMSEAGITPDRNSTRAIYAVLVQSADCATAAVDVLLDLSRTHPHIPIVAFNVVLEALCAFDQTSRALALYQQVRLICPTARPDRHTFQLLFTRCTTAHLARFLIAEMIAFQVPIAPDMYDFLVWVNATAIDGDLSAAFRYVLELEHVVARREERQRARRPAPAERLLGAERPITLCENTNFSQSNSNSTRSTTSTSRPHSTSRSSSLLITNDLAKPPHSDNNDADSEEDDYGNSNPWISARTLAALIKRAFEAEDHRIWPIVDSTNARSMDVDEVLLLALAAMPEEKKEKWAAAMKAKAKSVDKLMPEPGAGSCMEGSEEVRREDGQGGHGSGDEKEARLKDGHGEEKDEHVSEEAKKKKGKRKLKCKKERRMSGNGINRDLQKIAPKGLFGVS